MSNRPTFSILHPSARPDKWREVYADWTGKAIDPSRVGYVLCADERWGFQRYWSDPAGREIEAGDYGYDMEATDKLVWNEGRRCYVDSVNTAARAATGDILIVIADDQFACEGWDEKLLALLKEKRYGDGRQFQFVISASTGTPNEHERGIMVMPILSRARYEQQGSVVFYPEYESMFADNDFAEWAKQDWVIANARHLMFEHRHWMNGKREKDAADEAQNRLDAWKLGELMLERRRAAGFGPWVPRKESAEIQSSQGPDTTKINYNEITPKRLAVTAAGADETNVSAPARSIVLCLSGDHFQGAWLDGILALIFHLMQRGFNIVPLRSWITYTSNVYATREELRQAVNSLSPHPELILWLDDDNICSPAHFDRLLAGLDAHAETDGMAAWCWIHNEQKTTFQPSCGNFAPNGTHWQPFPQRFALEKEPRVFEAGGFPCFLMRYSAIEKAGNQPFIRGILDERLAHGIGGEDLAFFRAAQQGGAVFMVDPTVRVPHLKYVEVCPTLIEEGLPEVKIAVMMRVKNEARWIGRVIDSVKALGPVFVMDDGSMDDTVTIAKRHGGDVRTSPFSTRQLDERRDKNWMLEWVREPEYGPFDYVLCIDGDEELERGGVEKIRRACQQGLADVYYLRFLFLWDRPDQARFDGRYSTLSRFSLFRVRDDLSFQCLYDDPNINKGLHCGNAPLDLDKEVVGQALNVFLIHYGYMLKEDRLRKYEYYNQIDPNNEQEDCYRHIVQGDVPEVPATMKLKHGGPLELRTLPKSIAPDFDMSTLAVKTHEAVPIGRGDYSHAYAPASIRMVDDPPLRLNLGCSDALIPDFVNVDISGPCDLQADLTKPWPWKDSSVDRIRAFDIIEHLPNKVFTMNEAFRVLKDGGLFEIMVPTTDGRGAHQDPTHVSYWNRNSFFYFEHGNPHLTRFRNGNGVQCAFQIISSDERDAGDGVVKLHIRLAAVKGALAMAAD